MSFEKMEPLIRKNEIKENPDAKFIQAQMDEAIKQEDYEQAACLRDMLNDKEKNSPFKFFEKRLESEKNKEDSPETRALKGIEQKRQESYWEGKNIVEESDFSFDLTDKHRTEGVLGKKDWKQIKILKNTKSVEKLDFIFNLRNGIDEVSKILDLSVERFNDIWRAYCEKNGFSGPGYEEISSEDEIVGLTRERLEILEKSPKDIIKPIVYWHIVYDNSRIILKEFKKALDELT